MRVYNYDTKVWQHRAISRKKWVASGAKESVWPIYSLVVDRIRQNGTYVAGEDNNDWAAQCLRAHNGCLKTFILDGVRHYVLPGMSDKRGYWNFEIDGEPYICSNRRLVKKRLHRERENIGAFRLETPRCRKHLLSDWSRNVDNCNALLRRYGAGGSTMTEREGRYVTESFKALTASKNKYLEQYATWVPIQEVFPLYTMENLVQLVDFECSFSAIYRRQRDFLGIKEGTAEARIWYQRYNGLMWYGEFLRGHRVTSRFPREALVDYVNEFARYAGDSCLWTWLVSDPLVSLLINVLAPLFPADWDKTPKTWREVHECSPVLDTKAKSRGLVYVAYATGMAPRITNTAIHENWTTIEAMAAFINKTPGKVARSIFKHARYFYLARCAVNKTIVFCGVGDNPDQHASKSCRFTEWRAMLEPYLEAEGLQFHDHEMNAKIRSQLLCGANEDVGYESSEICQFLGDAPTALSVEEFLALSSVENEEGVRTYQTNLKSARAVIRHLTHYRFCRRFVILKSPEDGVIRFKQTRFVTEADFPHAIQFYDRLAALNGKLVPEPKPEPEPVKKPAPAPAPAPAPFPVPGPRYTFPAEILRVNMVNPYEKPEFCEFCDEGHKPRYCKRCDRLVYWQHPWSSLSRSACASCVEYAKANPAQGHPFCHDLAGETSCIRVIPDNGLRRVDYNERFRGCPRGTYELNEFRHSIPSYRWVKLDDAAKVMDISRDRLIELITNDFANVTVARLDGEYWVHNNCSVGRWEEHLLVSWEDWQRTVLGREPSFLVAHPKARSVSSM